MCWAATKFALAMGFVEEDLHTDESRYSIMFDFACLGPGTAKSMRMCHIFCILVHQSWNVLISLTMNWLEVVCCIWHLHHIICYIDSMTRIFAIFNIKSIQLSWCWTFMARMAFSCQALHEVHGVHFQDQLRYCMANWFHQLKWINCSFYQDSLLAPALIILYTVPHLGKVHYLLGEGGGVWAGASEGDHQ